MSPAVVYGAVQRFSGDWVRAGTDRDGNPRYRPLKVSNALTDNVHQLVRKRRWAIGYFNDAVLGIAFENSFVRADGSEWDHDPHNRATVAVPTRYEPFVGDPDDGMSAPDKEPPELFEQTLREIFAPDDDAEQKLHLT